MAGSEKTFETKVKKFLMDQGCWILKTWSNGIQRQGVPDLLVCCNGYFVGIELKADNGKPSELQLWNIRKIRESGGFGIVLYPHDFYMLQDLIFDLKKDVDVRFWHMHQSFFDRKEVNHESV